MIAGGRVPSASGGRFGCVDTEPLLVVEHEAQCPPGWMGEWLAEAGVPLDVRRPYAGDELPEDLRGHRGMMVLGGEMGAHDGPTVPLARGRPAAGPRAADEEASRCSASAWVTSWWRWPSAATSSRTRAVSRSASWTSAGLPAAYDDPLLGALAAGDGDLPTAVQWNNDVVTRLPDGAVALARTAGGEVQAVRFARRVWGVQWHPEAGEEIIGPWAEHDRDAALERGVDLDAYVGDVAAARDRLRADVAGAGGPLRRGLPRAGGARRGTDVIPGRITTETGRLTRLGFEDADGSARALERLGPAGAVLVHLLAATADPDRAAVTLADLADRVDDRAALLEEVVDDEGTAMRLLTVLGASPALGDHLLRHPGQWRDLTDPLLGSTRPTARAMREELLRAVRRGPVRAGPGLHRARRGVRGRPPGDLPPAAAPTGRAGPLARRRGRRRGRRALRPGRRHPRRRPGRRAGPGRDPTPTWPGSRWWRWASAAATSSTTSATWT